MFLDDGTVIPSLFGVTSRGIQGAGDSLLNEYSLRVGEVKKMILPTDKLSYSKRFIEYEVDVQHQERNNAYTTVTFRGCFVNNIFGGGADYFTATLRSNPLRNGNETNIWGNGSKVLILCISGDQRKGVILGGFPDASSKISPPQDETHNLAFEFNGLNFKINDDGEATVKFRGKTNVDGTLASSANPAAEGSCLNFNKDGNIEIATPDKNQFIRINHANKKIEILADAEWNVSVNQKIAISAGSDIDINGGGTATLTVPNNISLQSAGVKVGAATDAFVKGSTYRNAEALMNNQLISYFKNLGEMMQKAGEQAAQGNIPGALTLIVATSPLFTSISNTISTFENLSSTYLSNKNHTD